MVVPQLPINEQSTCVYLRKRLYPYRDARAVRNPTEDSSEDQPVETQHLPCASMFAGQERVPHLADPPRRRMKIGIAC